MATEKQARRAAEPRQPRKHTSGPRPSVAVEPEVTSPKRSLTDEHKEAIAAGRRENAIVDAYLRAIQPRRRGRRVPAAVLEAKLAELEAERDSVAPGTASLDLLTEIAAITKRLRVAQAEEAATADIAEHERDFVAVAKSYSDRKGTPYEAWRAVGVPSRVLKTAGISRRG